MTGREYLEIFQGLKLRRSSLVKLLEKQVKILEENNLFHEAEETKWLAIEIAAIEKEQKYEFDIGENKMNLEEKFK